MSRMTDWGGRGSLAHQRSTMTRAMRITSRSPGAFSQRERVGCEHRSTPLSGSRPQASLSAGSVRRLSRSSASSYPHAMAKIRARRMSGKGWMVRAGSRGSGITAASFSAMPSRRSAAARSITPPSELMRPPSKAAMTFLRDTAGKEKGSSVLCVMAGVAALKRAEGLVSQLKFYAASGTYATPASPEQLPIMNKTG